MPPAPPGSTPFAHDGRLKAAPTTTNTSRSPSGGLSVVREWRRGVRRCGRLGVRGRQPVTSSHDESSRRVVLGGDVALAELGVVTNGPGQPAPNRMEPEILIAADTFHVRFLARIGDPGLDDVQVAARL